MTERRDRTLGDAVTRVGQAKQRAAAARNAARQGAAPAGPPPKEVFFESCRAIGAAFAADGFAWRQTGPKLVRRDGDFTEEVVFQSSTHNVAGVSVALVCHARLASKALKAWRGKVRSPFGDNDHVGGGQLGNLREPHEWITWNLADAEARPETIARVIDLVRELALPLFVHLRDLEWLASASRDGGDVPGLLWPHQVVEVLLAHQRSAAAATYLQALARRPELASEAAALYRTYERDGVPKPCGLGGGYASQIAALAVHYRLPLTKGR